jgi:SAM-dependent methyltransferase
MDHKSVFNTIYVNDVWRESREEPWPVEANSQVYRPVVERFIKSHGIRSIVDIGCGSWEPNATIELNGADYVGVDVSDVVLAQARRNTPPGMKFINANVLTDPVPRADLLLMKDVLQHWSNADVLTFLPKIRAFRYALITNGFVSGNENESVNVDIVTGDWRPIDLTRPPFNLKGHYLFSFNTTPMALEKVLLITNS